MPDDGPITGSDGHELSVFEPRRSRSELEHIADELRLFRYCDLQGSTICAGAELAVAFALFDVATLINRLGADIAVTESSSPEGELSIEGVPVRVFAVPGRVQLSLSGAEGDLWAVTEADIARAKRLEEILEPLRDVLIDPPRADERCLSPERYPELFPSGGDGG